MIGDQRYSDRLTYDGTWENNLFNFIRMVFLKESSNVVKEKGNVTKEFVKAKRQISSLFVVIPQRKALYL